MEKRAREKTRRTVYPEERPPVMLNSDSSDEEEENQEDNKKEMSEKDKSALRLFDRAATPLNESYNYSEFYNNLAKNEESGFERTDGN